MEYFITFIEGIITFISPCLLPMLPIYISYFAGQEISNKKRKVLVNAIGFILGFTVVFMILGALSATLGKLIKEYMVYINIVFGTIIVLFGLNFMQVLEIPFFNVTKRIKISTRNLGVLSSFVFGLAFGIGWTPCIGTFLGSALLLVTTQGEVIKGIVMLLCFSIGLGIPFIISAILIDKLKSTFDFIKKNYKIINVISGIFLILMGILMMFGQMGKFLSMISI
jgi:cytochrome c-type biogenesis protein